MTTVAAFAAEPKQQVLLPGAEHFFVGQLELMQRTLSGWLKEQLP
jgi:alpha/beta superfamily hydrolase